MAETALLATRRGFLALAAGTAVAATLPVAALAKSTPPQSLTLKGVGQVLVESRVLTIVSIDQSSRDVIVKTDNGDQFAYRIAPIVGSLAGYKPGEKVTVYIAPGAVTKLQKVDSGQKGLISQVQLDISATGPLPENFWGTSITMNVVLVDVNTDHKTVTFEGHDKLLRIIPAATPAVWNDIAQIQPGDLATITWIEAMAFIPKT